MPHSVQLSDTAGMEWSCRLMAWTGQAATHIPHPLQALLSTTAAIFSMKILILHKQKKVKTGYRQFTSEQGM
jgi:hypothetical protein